MNDSQLRDDLAAERTRLANERTLLAYIRTALALAGAGAILLHFFPYHPWLWALAGLLIGTGGVVTMVGVYRFVTVGRRIPGSRG